MALVANVVPEVVPYNDISRINDQKYQFSVEDRLIKASKVVPEWPYFGRLFKTTSHGRCELNFTSARDGFSPEGKMGNSAIAWFGANPIKFKTICALSRLITENKMFPHDLHEYGANPLVETAENAFTNTAHHYLRYLADRDILFFANTQKQQFSFKYAHSCWNDLLYVGIESSLVRVAQTLDMISQFSAAEGQYFSTEGYSGRSLAGTGSADNPMVRSFPNGLKSVFEKLILDKKFSSDLNDEAIFVGDTKFFINVPLKIESINTASVALYVSIPSPQQDNLEKIIPAFVGEPYGALSVGLSAGFSWNISALINPHFFSYAQYSIPRTMARRVPRRITRSVSTNLPYVISGSEAPVDIIAVDNITAMVTPLALSAVSYVDYRKTANVDVADADLSLFADGITSINIRRGPEVGIQVGNVFENVLFKEMQLDVSYKFNFKANDVLGPIGGDVRYDRDSVVKNTARRSHVVSATLNYDYVDSINFFAGFNYTIAGRSNLKEVSFSVGMAGVF